MSVVATKIASLLRCVERARSEHKAAGEAFAEDFTRQDAAILNVLRACETAVDLANMALRQKRVGFPANMKQSFALLADAGLIPQELARRLQRMIGFRNIAVHQYRKLDLTIVDSVIAHGLDDLLQFAEIIRVPLRGGTSD